MARKPNYRFEKNERERKKAAKKAEKAERLKANAKSDTDETQSAPEGENDAPRPTLSLWPTK